MYRNPCCGYSKPTKVGKVMPNFELLDLDSLSDFDKVCLTYSLYKEFYDLLPYQLLPNIKQDFLLDERGDFKIAEVEQKIIDFCRQSRNEDVAQKTFKIMLSTIEDSKKCPTSDLKEKMDYYIQKRSNKQASSGRFYGITSQEKNGTNDLPKADKALLIMIRTRHILSLVNQPSKTKQNEREM